MNHVIKGLMCRNVIMQGKTANFGSRLTRGSNQPEHTLMLIKVFDMCSMAGYRHKPAKSLIFAQIAQSDLSLPQVHC